MPAPADGALVDAEVEALRPGDRAEVVIACWVSTADLGALLGGELRVVGDVAVRADHQVARAVRVQVEHREGDLASSYDEARPHRAATAPGRTGSRRTPGARLVLALDVGHPVRGPEPLEAGRVTHPSCRPPGVRPGPSYLDPLLDCLPDPGDGLFDGDAVVLPAVAVAERDSALLEVAVAGDHHEGDLLQLGVADLLLHPVVWTRRPRPGSPAASGVARAHEGSPRAARRSGSRRPARAPAKAGRRRRSAR